MPPACAPNSRELSVDKPAERRDEVPWLQCLAHTFRLEGDYVAAQAVEREIERLLAAPATPRPPAGVKKPLGALIRFRSALVLGFRRLRPDYKGDGGK
jgi:hypothetical protein